METLNPKDLQDLLEFMDRVYTISKGTTQLPYVARTLVGAKRIVSKLASEQTKNVPVDAIRSFLGEWNESTNTITFTVNVTQRGVLYNTVSSTVYTITRHQITDDCVTVFDSCFNDALGLVVVKSVPATTDVVEAVAEPVAEATSTTEPQPQQSPEVDAPIPPKLPVHLLRKRPMRCGS